MDNSSSENIEPISTSSPAEMSPLNKLERGISGAATTTPCTTTSVASFVTESEQGHHYNLEGDLNSTTPEDSGEDEEDVSASVEDHNATHRQPEDVDDDDIDDEQDLLDDPATSSNTHNEEDYGGGGDETSETRTPPSYEEGQPVTLSELLLLGTDPKTGNFKGDFVYLGSDQGQLWNASVVLLRYLDKMAASTPGFSWEGKRILELGSGLGHLAFALAERGANVYCTEQPKCCGMLAASLLRQNERRFVVHLPSVTPIKWGDQTALRELLEDIEEEDDDNAKTLDFVLCSELFYDENAHEDLISCWWQIAEHFSKPRSYMRGCDIIEEHERVLREEREGPPQTDLERERSGNHFSCPVVFYSVFVNRPFSWNFFAKLDDEMKARKNSTNVGNISFKVEEAPGLPDDAEDDFFQGLEDIHLHRTTVDVEYRSEQTPVVVGRNSSTARGPPCGGGEDHHYRVLEEVVDEEENEDSPPINNMLNGHDSRSSTTSSRSRSTSPVLVKHQLLAGDEQSTSRSTLLPPASPVTTGAAASPVTTGAAASGSDSSALAVAGQEVDIKNIHENEKQTLLVPSSTLSSTSASTSTEEKGKADKKEEESTAIGEKASDEEEDEKTIWEILDELIGIDPRKLRIYVQLALGVLLAISLLLIKQARESGETHLVYLHSGFLFCVVMLSLSVEFVLAEAERLTREKKLEDEEKKATAAEKAGLKSENGSTSTRETTTEASSSSHEDDETTAPKKRNSEATCDGGGGLSGGLDLE
ncbi:unnamed protein product [Amoebophrya sp. A25]|nr:unnamed protein product [Amoebophrya sp. A25]|eukprot:GSA25T00005018001.1